MFSSGVLSQEISDDLTNSLTELLALQVKPEFDSVQQKSYVIYTLPLDLQDLSPDSLILREARSVLASSGNTGVRTWEAALRLGKYLCSAEGRKLVSRKALLELGAGTGFLSILCAKHLQARYVLATDGNSQVVEALRSNISLNEYGEDQTIETSALQWGHTPIDEVSSGGQEDRQYDLILGADIVSYFVLAFALSKMSLSLDDPVTNCNRLTIMLWYRHWCHQSTNSSFDSGVQRCFSQRR